MLTQREMLQRSVEYRANSVALELLDTGETLTYAEFDKCVNKLSNALHERGIRSGDRIPLVLFNTVEFPLTLFACYKIGAVPVPLNFHLALDNFTYIFDDLDPSLTVYDEEVSDAVEAGLDDAIRSPDRIRVGSTPTDGESFETVISSGSETEPPQLPTNEGGISHILYTSGTTGKPKGVTITQETAYHRIQEAFSSMNVTQDTVSLQLSPWFHAGGLGNTLHPTLCAGGTLIVTRDWDPETVADVVDEHGVSYIVCVPTVAQRIANLDDVESYDFSSIEALLCQGAPLSTSLAETLIDTVTPNIFNGYGSTETLYDLLLRPEDLPEHAGAAGRPSPDKELRVVEFDSDRDVSPDERADVGKEGEIIVRGESIMDYYFENREATDDAFEDDWFYSTDLGVKDEDGYVTITGRADDMILSGGELVSPVEVEETLEEHENIESAVVVGVPDEEWGQRVKAFVRGEALTDEDLDAYCRGHEGLANYKRPREYEFVDTVERTATGKKQRFKYRPE